MIEEPTSILVDVTAEDIAHGEREDCTKCPIARALRRHKGFEKAYVNDQYVEIDHENRHENLYRLPQEAVDFIRNFDDGKEVRPFKFELDLTDE